MRPRQQRVGDRSTSRGRLGLPGTQKPGERTANRREAWMRAQVSRASRRCGTSTEGVLGAHGPSGLCGSPRASSSTGANTEILFDKTVPPGRQKAERESQRAGREARVGLGPRLFEGWAGWSGGPQVRKGRARDAEPLTPWSEADSAPTAAQTRPLSPGCCAQRPAPPGVSPGPLCPRGCWATSGDPWGAPGMARTGPGTLLSPHSARAPPHTVTPSQMSYFGLRRRRSTWLLPERGC